MKSNYREDIDGLRAVSVLAVMLFHADIAMLSGGFVGVDIFFVISGFVITASILSDVARDEFTLGNFYERRVRRIVPAAFAMVVVTSLVAWFVLLPGDFERFAKSLLAFGLFGSNWFFYSETGYFDISAMAKPLLHTWSLSIEEQFYLLYPLLLVTAIRWRLHAIIIPALVFLSLAYSRHLWVTGNPDGMFFSSAGRFWELLLGCSAAIFVSRYSLPELASRLARIVGAVAILWALFTITADHNYRALLLPCVGAALLLIATPQSHDPVYSLLSSRPARYVGQISYALYLWHWPILVFARMYFDALSPAVVIGCVAVTFALATISLHLIENPIRRKRWPKRRLTAFGMAGAATAATVLFAAIGVYYEGLPFRVPERVRMAYAATADFDKRIHACFTVPKGDFITDLVPMAKEDRLCFLGDQTKPTVDFIVWGDSHAWAMSSAFDELGKRHGKKGAFASYAACAPLIGTYHGGAKHYQCPQFFDAVKAYVERHDIKTVFFVARWSYYAIGGMPGTNESKTAAIRLVKHPEIKDTLSIVRSAVEDTVTAFPGKNLVFVEEVPHQGINVPSALAPKLMFGQTATGIWETRQKHIERTKPVRDIFANLSAEANVNVLDPTDLLCPDNECTVISNGKPLYWDDDHLNRSGAIFIAPMLEGAFRRTPAPTTATLY